MRKTLGCATSITPFFGGGMRGKRAYRPAALSSELAWLWTTLLLVSGSAVQAQTPGPEFINPPGLTRPTGYTHVVVSADGRTAYVAGQVSSPRRR
jgi:hypothetical protein